MRLVAAIVMVVMALANHVAAQQESQTDKISWSSDGMNFVRDADERVIGNADGGGYALKGYDPVSYFEGNPRRGVAKYAAVHNGMKYKFTSAENRSVFLADPEQYVPRYGGFCAYGVVHDRPHLSDLDPLSYLFISGKLTFFLNDRVRERYINRVKNESLRAVLEEGDQKWRRLQRDPLTWEDVSPPPEGQ